MVHSLVDKVGVKEPWPLPLTDLVLCILLFIKLAAPFPRLRGAGGSAGILADLYSGPAMARDAVGVLRRRGFSLCVLAADLNWAERRESDYDRGTDSIFNSADPTGAVVAGSLSDRVNWKR